MTSRRKPTIRRPLGRLASVVGRPVGVAGASPPADEKPSPGEASRRKPPGANLAPDSTGVTTEIGSASVVVWSTGKLMRDFRRADRWDPATFAGISTVRPAGRSINNYRLPAAEDAYCLAAFVWVVTVLPAGANRVIHASVPSGQSRAYPWLMNQLPARQSRIGPASGGPGDIGHLA